MKMPEQIERVIQEAVDNPDKFPGMTYAQGVENALLWVIDQAENGPMED